MSNSQTQVALSNAPADQAVLVEFAQTHGISPSNMLSTLVATIFPKGNRVPTPTPSQVYALLFVAKKYGLDPFLKELYAFPAKGGGITPMVSIDGWLNIANRHPQFDGLSIEEFEDPENGMPIACAVTVYRKDRDHPLRIKEWVRECRRSSIPWDKQPTRMIRHRATGQAIRYAFSLAGVYLEDEAEAIFETDFEVTTSGKPQATGNSVTDDFNDALEVHAEGCKVAEEAAADEATDDTPPFYTTSQCQDPEKPPGPPEPGFEWTWDDSGGMWIQVAVQVEADEDQGGGRDE